MDNLKQSVSLKLFVITVLALLLLIPTSMVESLIEEREANRDFAIQEVSEKWGSEQVLSGPFLSIPYKKLHQSKEGVTTYSVHYAHFLPESLVVNSKVDPITRKRGIYEVVLYNGALDVAGHFKKPDFKIWNIDPELILWEDATLSIGISDLTGIQERIRIKWNERVLPISPGLVNHQVTSSGVSTRVPIADAGVYNFGFKLSLNGSTRLGITPIGKETKIAMKSPWPNPSFNGRFLPDNHDINESGFSANWTVLDLNRNYPQQWLASNQKIDESVFGVDFILPVDEYQKNMRSAKYAALIIALTFLIFFLVEVLNQKRFHPIQYALVGLVITIFYALLLSITEHLGFQLAYLIAASMTVSLILTYISSIFKSTRLSIITGIALSGIYFFIYVILQLQDFSLLVGSLGLFIALGTLMFLSRKVNWYNINPQTEAA
ncbi:cell envelope integrity protein CreD [Fulvivirga sp. RKSG066]|nr:cell envelope integrity protein CreD [Fulvivirga aurantia]